MENTIFAFRRVEETNGTWIEQKNISASVEDKSYSKSRIGFADLNPSEQIFFSKVFVLEGATRKALPEVKYF